MPPRRPDTAPLAARIGGNALSARHMSGVTQDAVARSAGISTSMLSKVENGHALPGVATLLDTARALNVEPGVLLREAAAEREAA